MLCSGLLWFGRSCCFGLGGPVALVGPAGFGWSCCFGRACLGFGGPVAGAPTRCGDAFSPKWDAIGEFLRFVGHVIAADSFISMGSAAIVCIMGLVERFIATHLGGLKIHWACRAVYCHPSWRTQDTLGLWSGLLPPVLADSRYIFSCRNTTVHKGGIRTDVMPLSACGSGKRWLELRNSVSHFMYLRISASGSRDRMEIWRNDIL